MLCSFIATMDSCRASNNFQWIKCFPSIFANDLYMLCSLIIARLWPSQALSGCLFLVCGRSYANRLLTMFFLGYVFIPVAVQKALGSGCLKMPAIMIICWTEVSSVWLWSISKWTGWVTQRVDGFHQIQNKCNELMNMRDEWKWLCHLEVLLKLLTISNAKVCLKALLNIPTVISSLFYFFFICFLLCLRWSQFILGGEIPSRRKLLSWID